MPFLRDYNLKENWLTLIISSTIIVIFAFSEDSQARTPYDPYDAPADSVIAWFHDHCNQHQQVRAFWQIMKVQNLTDPPWKLIDIEPFYNTQPIRDAFEFFVRSISIDKDILPPCSVFYPSAYLGSSGDTTISFDWEGPPITNYVLSLYMGLGYTKDLNEIAYTIYVDMEREEYTAWIWDRIGSGFFQYLLNELQNDQNTTLPLDIAAIYLLNVSAPNEDSETLALEILHEGAISSSNTQRRWTGLILPRIYVSGYSQVRTDIDLLLNDVQPSVRSAIRGEIKFQQKYKNRMLNFLNDE